MQVDKSTRHPSYLHCILPHFMKDYIARRFALDQRDSIVQFLVRHKVDLSAIQKN